MKSIRKLPSDVCSVVRSGVVIPTPAQAVVELVLNSIDAGASSIAVRVDLRLFKIQVIDNGNGITVSDLEVIGSRSATSKCYTLDEYYNNLMYHGFRGEALASLREMCGLLEIVTHPTDDKNTYSKLFIHGKEESMKVSELKRPTHGTTVTLTDFMFNMPVRRERMKETVELEAIRSCIEYIALAHPEISVTVRNDSKGRIILEKHKSSNLLSAFEHLFGHNLARTLAAVNYATDKFKISGYISKEPYRHNDLQFIYVNRQPVIKTKLHKLVCVLLSKSSIIRTNGPWKSKPIPQNVPVERWLSFPSLEKQKKFAVFVINIECARKEYEMCWDSKKPLIYFKDLEGILSCLSNAIQQFLNLENLVEDCEEETDQNNAKNDSGCSSLIEKVQDSRDFSSNNNHHVDFEVETWDIQGAVHGIIAKRPRGTGMDSKRNLCEGSEVHIPDLNKVENKYLTPDIFVSKEENMQTDQSSVPPVVKFLGKYETPPATRLKITKGAYRLKMMEEEQKKLKVAQRLGKFKFSSKPKLNSMKNSLNQEEHKLLSLNSSNVERKVTTSFKTDIQKNEKGIKKVSNTVNSHITNNAPNVSLIRINKDTISSVTGKSFDCDFGRDQFLCEDQTSQQVLPSVKECVNIPKSVSDLSWGIANNYSRKFSLNTTSVISDSINEKSNSSADREQCTSTATYGGTSGCSSSFMEVNNEIQFNSDINKSGMKSVNSHEYLFKSGENSGYTASNVYGDAKETVTKYRHLSSCNVDKHLCHERGGYSFKDNSSCPVPLGISKMTIISIPTPQCEIFPNTTPTSTSLDNKYVCWKKESQKNYMDQDNNRKDICSFSPPSFADGHQQPDSLRVNTSRSVVENFLFDLNVSEEAENNSSTKATVETFFPLSKTVGDIHKNSRTTCTLQHSSSAELQQPTQFSFPNKKTYDLTNGIGKSDGEKRSWYREQTELNSISYMAQLSQKNMNCKSNSELLEKLVKDNNIMAEIRSPYFNVQTNSDLSKKNQEIINQRNTSKNIREIIVQTGSENDKDQNVKGQVNKETTVAVFEVPGNDQEMELLPCLLNERKNMVSETSREQLVNFSFSGCDLDTGDSQKFCELVKVQNEPTCNNIVPLPFFTEDSNTHYKILSPLKFLEDLGEETDVTERRQLSHESREVFKEAVDLTCVRKEHTKVQQFGVQEKHWDSACPFYGDTETTKGTEIIEDTPGMEKEGLCGEESGKSIKDTLTEDWLQLKNTEGNFFYFHVPSGFTSYKPPIAKDASLYSMSKRFKFLPKGMSPLLATLSVRGNHGPPLNCKNSTSETFNLTSTFKDKEDLKTVKWRNKPDDLSDEISNLLNNANPSCRALALSSTSVIPDLSFFCAKMSGLLLQQKFDKRIFTNIEVIGQLDNKFIITLVSWQRNSSPHILGIFDQHAVHERIRLETLMKEYSSEKDGWSFTSTDLNVHIIMAVSSKEHHIMANFQNKFEKLGLYFILIDNDNVEIQKIPTCLYTRFQREKSIQWLETTLHILIQDIVLFLIKTNGQDSVVPEVFKDVINSEACKGAIKFGDPLSVTQCEDLLSSLSKCDLPFYCAHGRPSFMPIFDLRQFEIERKKYVPESLQSLK